MSAVVLVAACAENPSPVGLPPIGTPDGSGPIACNPNDVDPCPDGMVCVAGLCEDASFGDGGTGEMDASPQFGRVVITPEEIDFGALIFGESVERTATIRNEGLGTLQVLQIEVERNDAMEFEVLVSETLPVALERGEVVIVRLRYSPRDGQADFDRLEVVTDDPAEPVARVPLSAEFKGTNEIAVVRDAATTGPEMLTLDFGDVPLGSNRTLTVFVKNVGTGNSLLEILDVRTDPTPSLQFSVDTSSATPVYLNRFRPSALCNMGACVGDATCVDGLCLQPNGAPVDTLKIDVTFEPTDEGMVGEDLVLSNTDADGDENPYVVQLIGVGVQAHLQVNPDPIDLGTVFVGFPTDTVVELANVGADILTLTSVGLFGTSPGISLSSTSSVPADVPAQDNLTVTVTADPASDGLFSGALQIVSNDPDLPVRDVPITGSALFPPIIRTSTPSIELPDVHVFRVPGESTVATILITNDGGSPLTLTSIGFGPGNTTDFWLNPTSIQPLVPQQSVSLEIHYAPLVVGPDIATLVLTTNDPATPRVEIPITANAIDPTTFLFKSSPPPIPASPVVFAPRYRGSPAPAITVIIQNTGVGPLRVDSISLGSGSSTDISLADIPALPGFVLPGTSSLTFSVNYMPSGLGADNGAIDPHQRPRRADQRHLGAGRRRRLPAEPMGHQQRRRRRLRVLLRAGDPGGRGLQSRRRRLQRRHRRGLLDRAGLRRHRRVRGGRHRVRGG